MGYSQVQICNLALAHLGISTSITSIDESSVEARMCRRVFDPSLDAVLADFDWPFAIRTTTVALVEEEPTTEWGYSYRLPADAVAIRRVHSGVSRMDSPATRITYALGADDTGGLLYTSQPEAVIEYTVRPASTTVLPADVVQALAYLLASELAPSLTQGDARKHGLLAFEKYQRAIRRAKVRAANLDVDGPEADSAFVLARG